MTEWDPITESFDVDTPSEPSEPDHWPEPCDWSWGNEDPNQLEWWVIEAPY